MDRQTRKQIASTLLATADIVEAANVANAYRSKKRVVDAQIKEIQKLLSRHERGAEDNWAKVGDLGHVSESLADVLQFLKG